jgi:hypothetical protein
LTVRQTLQPFFSERITMTNFRRTLLAIVSVAVAVSLAGCITSISSRNATPGYQNYQPIPQGPVETPPLVEPAPEPFVPPTPSTTRGLGIRTTSFFQSMGDKVRDTFHR